MQNDSPDTEKLLVPWPRVVTFTRQLSHDVRNGLNALDLEASYITELNTDPEIAEELKKLRVMVVNITKMLHGVSSTMGAFSMNPIDLEAEILLGELRERLTKLQPKEMEGVSWSVKLGDESLEVDIERLWEATREIFENAFQFRENGKAIAFAAHCEGALLFLELREEKTAPVAPGEWGTPLLSTRRGGFGLGLFHAGRVLAAHGGELTMAYDGEAAAVVTRMTLPLKK